MTDESGEKPGSVEMNRTFLVVVDDSEELRVALHFASRRAKRTGGRVSLLYVQQPAEFQHWMAVGDLMREEARNEMGVENLRLELPRAKASPNIAQEWPDALIRNQQRVGLYPAEVGRVGFLGNRLFRTRLTLPANVPTGASEAKVYFLREGQIVSAQTTPLFVNKIGLEAEIFDFAYEQSALYGIIAILVALMAGWLAHVAFRRP